MRLYTLTELFCRTRNELFALHAEIVTELASLPEGSPDAPVAQNNLRLIRRALSRLRPEP